MKIRTIVLLLSVLHSCTAVKTITNENWRDMLKGEWMVKFYAPWCPACRAMSGTWKSFAEWAGENMDTLSVGSVDVTAQGELNGRFMVTSLPTIYHVKDGEFRQYSSSRSIRDFKEFVVEQKWRPIKPMSAWLSPDSVAMSGVSKLFSFSMNLKTFHESLRNDYGLPGWASMVLFGLAILVIGLLLGIGLVFLIDWFMGPQPDYPGEPLGQPAEEEEENLSKDSGNEEEIEELNAKEEDGKKSTVRKRTAKAD